jgi:hypothetical protein
MLAGHSTGLQTQPSLPAQFHDVMATVTITGAVTVGGIRYPCEITIEVPDNPVRKTGKKKGN